MLAHAGPVSGAPQNGFGLWCWATASGCQGCRTYLARAVGWFRLLL